MLLTLGTMLAIGSFSLLNAQPAGTNRAIQSTSPGVFAEPILFEWRAGYGDSTINGFLDRIKTNFGFDLRASADIPPQMLRVSVPSMKITTRRVWDVLYLYNQISNDYPGIGRWALVRHGVEPRNLQSDYLSDSPPDAILLIPPKQTDLEEALSVRAFTLRDIPGEEQRQLFDLIDVEGRNLKLETEKGIKASLLRGDVHFHRETGICVATGGKTYVEMVGSLIDAFRSGRRGGSLPYTTKPQDKK